MGHSEVCSFCSVREVELTALLSGRLPVNYIIHQLWTGVFILLVVSPLYAFTHFSPFNLTIPV